MSGNRSALRRAFVPVLIVLGLCLVPGQAAAAKGETDVSISVAPAAMGQYEYTVRVRSDKSRCERHRKVIVWHDENRNGTLDKGEFVIGEGRTKRSGRLSFQSTALPPVGDFIGVYVKGSDRCESFEDSAEFTGFPQ